MLILIAVSYSSSGRIAFQSSRPFWRDRMTLLVGQLQWKGLYAVISIADSWASSGLRPRPHTPAILYTPPLAEIRERRADGAGFPARTCRLPSRKNQDRDPASAPRGNQAVATAHCYLTERLPLSFFLGSFLVWAVVDRISLKTVCSGPIETLPASRFNDAIAVIGGLALYVLFVWRAAFVAGRRVTACLSLKRLVARR